MSTNTTTRTPALSVTVDEAAQSLTLTFGDGREPVTINPAEFSEDVRAYAMLHGFKQKLVDAAAIPRDTETGRSATPAQKADAVMTVLNTLRVGHWNKPRGEGSGTASAGGLLYRALCRMYAGKMDAEAVRAWLAGKDKEQQAALRGNARIAAIIAEIKAEDAAKAPVNAGDDLLAELDGAE